MTEDPYEPFLASLMQTLTKNGYPAKRVALPLEKMYEVAYGKGLNFNKALEKLAERGVGHEKTEQKVVFFAAETRGERGESAPPLAEMMRQAQEMLQTMSPEERRQLEEFIKGMSPEQRAEMEKKAREMGVL